MANMPTAEAEHDQVGAGDRSDPEEAQGHERVGRHPGLDEHEDERGGRPRRASTTRVEVAVHGHRVGVGDGVDEQEQGTGDGGRAGHVEALARARRPATRGAGARATTNRVMPMGTLTNRIHRHDRYWVRIPPNSAPAAPPPAATALHTPKARARARWSGR